MLLTAAILAIFELQVHVLKVFTPEIPGFVAEFLLLESTGALALMFVARAYRRTKRHGLPQI